MNTISLRLHGASALLRVSFRKERLSETPVFLLDTSQQCQYIFVWMDTSLVKTIDIILKEVHNA